MLKVKTRKQGNSSLLDTSSSSLNSIRAGQKYQKRGRRGEERVVGRREEEEERRKISLKEEDRRRSKEEKPPCECGPVLERIGTAIEKDRVGAYYALQTYSVSIKHLDVIEGCTKCHVLSIFRLRY